MPLSTNWRDLGALFFACARSGSDSNVGDQSNPWQTIEKIAQETEQITSVRSGYYKLPQTITNALRGVRLVADGFCVIDGNDAPGFANNFCRNGFEGFVLVGINYSMTANPPSVEGYNQKRNVFIGCQINFLQTKNQAFGYTENLLINTSYLESREAGVFRTTWIGSSVLDSYSTYKKSAFNKTSFLGVSNNRTNTFDTCAFEASTNGMGSFTLDGTDIKDFTLDGDAGDIGSTYSDGESFSGELTDANGNRFVFVNCFYTSDMGFNDEANNNFTLRQSPQSKLFNNNNIIGCYGIHKAIGFSDDPFDPSRSGVSYTNVSVVNGALEIDSGFNEGVVTSSDNLIYAIDLGEELTINQAIRFFGTFDFSSGQWLDRLNFDDPNNLEVRFSYRLQFYDSTLSTWSGWIEQEVDVIPGLDNANRGVGNPDVVFSQLGLMRTRYLRVEITLRKDGV